MSHKNNKGENILHSSTKYGSELIFQKLLELKVGIEWNNKGLHLVHYVAKYGNKQMIDILLRINGDYINLLTEGTLMTTLIMAVKYKNDNVANHLLNRGVDIGQSDIFGNYPHHYALITNNYKLFNILHKKEPVYAMNNFGYLPYDYFLKILLVSLMIILIAKLMILLNW